MLSVNLELSNKKILLTGAAGFIGAATAKRLLESFEGRMSFKTKGRPYFVYEAKGNEKNLIDTADEVLEKMQVLVS